MKQKVILWQLIVWTATLFFLNSLIASERQDSLYEIISHYAGLRLIPDTKDIQCTDTLVIRFKGKEDRIDLTLAPIYKIEFLNVDGKDAKYYQDGTTLHVDDFHHDSLLYLIVRYSGKFLFRSEFSSITSERAIFRDLEILPTGISNFQNIRLSITVPKDWEAIAGGNLANISSDPDFDTYVWEMNQPVSEIGWICAGRFSHRDLSVGSVNISFRLFGEDSVSALSIFPLIRDALTFYSNQFSPYRFKNLSIVEIEDWVGGGNVLAIASPSIIMVKKLAFTTNDQFNKVESILAHEIAHQWFPFSVFIDDRDAAFLAEGMCEYSSILFHEKYGNMSRRDSLSCHPLLRPLLMRVQKGKDVPLRQRADLRSMVTQYLKASYVHHMLRRLIGDTCFLRLYHEYVMRFAGKKVGLAEFENLAEEASRKKLDWFFKQWVENRGIPQLKMYNVKSIQQSGKWTTYGRVRIVGYEKYTLSGKIGAISSNGSTTSDFHLGVDSIGNYHNDVPFEIITDYKPAKIILDPDGDLLKLQKLPPKLSDMREPQNGLLIVGTISNSDYLRHLAQKDSIALENTGWNISTKFDIDVTLNDLQNERIILYGKSDENRVVAEMGKKFPIFFRSDSLKINGEKIFDSTLTFMEVIDNPYINNGLLIWIAPLSNKANPEFLPYNSSWIVVRGQDEILSGEWEMEDQDLIIEMGK